MTKIPFKFTIHLSAEGVDEESSVDLFCFYGKSLFFVTTPATDIPQILPGYFCDVHDSLQRFRTCKLAAFSGIKNFI